MAASEAGRPLIYAAYRDKTLVNSFAAIHKYMKDEKITIRDLYQYLRRYTSGVNRGTIFDYIQSTPASFRKS